MTLIAYYFVPTFLLQFRTNMPLKKAEDLLKSEKEPKNCQGSKPVFYDKATGRIPGVKAGVVESLTAHQTHMNMIRNLYKHCK